MAVYSMMQYV